MGLTVEKAKESEVALAMSSLDASQQRLSSLIDQLEGRFNSVLKVVDDKPEALMPLVPMVALAGTIKIATNKINESNDRIASIIARCEL